MKKLLKINEVSRILNLSRSKTYQLAYDKRIPVLIIDGCIRVPEEDLVEWINSKIHKEEQPDMIKGGGIV